MIWFAAFAVLALFGVVLLRWGTRWGSTPEERTRTMPGDEYLRGGPRVRLVMTRAITIQAPPERVWPWIAQLGRGAGFYSVDWLDNGRKTSAWHLVSWVPEPTLGDATAIGYLRHIDPGHSVAWWVGDGRFIGSRARMVSCYQLTGEGPDTRLVSRISADIGGPLALIAMLAFACIDSIMACRQLIGLRDRVEYCERNPTTPRDPETGDRGQYQLYEILYASGESAGVTGKEKGARWRQVAIDDGILRSEGRDVRGLPGVSNPGMPLLMADVTIWHNPRCSKSRETLELIRGRGIEPTVIEYLKNPPTAEQIDAALDALGLEPRQLMRKKESVYSDLGLDDASLSRAQLVAAMLLNPVLIERPVVFRGKLARVGRPPANVLALLDT